MKRTFVIGDIHGALKALKQILSIINPAQDDTLIFLGDYVDGWPESAQVVDCLLELRKRCDCIFLKGNHDHQCEQWLKGEEDSLEWSSNKGISTVQSYGQLNELLKTEHIQFFSGLLLYHIDQINRLFVHAGFKNNDGPKFESTTTNLITDRTLWELALTMDKRVKEHPSHFPKKLRLFSEIYIGHTPTLINDSFEPIRACNMINMDTGAGFHGKLSAMEIYTSEIIQSDVVKTLYPDHLGRIK